MPTSSPYDSIPPEDIERGRLLGAVAYLPGLCVLGFVEPTANPFVRFHARQGFVLLFVEVVAWIALAIVHASIGRIPILGFLIQVLLDFGIGLGLLSATVYGAVKAASGEMARLPYLGDYIERVPF